MNPIEKTKNAIGAVRVRPMSTQVAEVRQNINLIQEAMKATMKKDVHYGIIPGCGKPSLYKAGAEVILALFKLSTDPLVTDLSLNGEIRYQVKVNITLRDKTFIGSGIGECSSGEDKYSWRVAVCEEEFAATPETMRRIKFRKDRYKGTVEQIQQVRVAPADMANTILKMAKKRALIDAVLTATGASDIFSQDIEDLPEGYIPPEAVPDQEKASNPQPQDAPETAPEPPPAQEMPPKDPGRTYISEAQGKRLYAIARSAGIDNLKEWLMFTFNIEHLREVPRDKYQEICERAENGRKQ